MSDTPEMEVIWNHIHFSVEKLNNKQSLFQVDTDLQLPKYY